MDLTRIKDMLINPVADKVAELLSPRIAGMVTDILKKEILEAQKYRIDKEFELEQLKLDMQTKTFCPSCKTHTVVVTTRTTSDVCTNCTQCRYEHNYPERTPPHLVTEDIKQLRKNRQTEYDTDMKL